MMNLLFFNFLVMNPFMEGGPLFMSLILMCLVLALCFIIKGFLNINKNEKKSQKMVKLAIDAGVLGLAIGFLGSVIGLITTFDSIQSMGNVEPHIFAAGLKLVLLTATFGLLTFVISRIGVLILRWRQH